VLVTGGVEERDLAAAVVIGAELPPSSMVAGRTNLTELVQLIATAERVVSNDTGVAHLTYALGVPSVVLFGPVSPQRWGPPPGPHEAIWHGRSGDPHAAVLDPGLAAITVDEVLAALDRLPDRTCLGASSLEVAHHG
jgi:ADP-heptose:LPS heptosyltransferase